MLSTLLGIVTPSSDEQPENALSPILVRDSPSVTLVIFEQPKNAFSPIVLATILNVASLLVALSRNALSPMDSAVMSALMMAEQSLNAE